MRQQEAKQEILLVTESSFAKRDLSLNDHFENNHQYRLNPVERLEEACWNGLLNEFLTTAPSNRKNGDKLFLWKIHVAETFLCVELYQSPSVIDETTSVDPYIFLPVKNYN